MRSHLLTVLDRRDSQLGWRTPGGGPGGEAFRAKPMASSGAVINSGGIAVISAKLGPLTISALR
jgi:hypothetical protein